MNADRSPDNSATKRAILPSLVTWILRLLRMFWLTELTLLLVVIYGLYIGWSASRQWSDGLFFAAVAQVMVAGIAMLGSSRDLSNAHLVRYVPDGNITETLQQLVFGMQRQQAFGMRAFVGGLITLLLSWFIMSV